MKIMTVCGFGVGTSLLLKMTVDSILEEEGINGEVEAIDMKWPIWYQKVTKRSLCWGRM